LDVELICFSPSAVNSVTITGDFVVAAFGSPAEKIMVTVLSTKNIARVNAMILA